MAKPTKKDVASRIVTAFPNAGFDTEWLIEDHTLKQLQGILSDLETGGADDKKDPSATAELYELGAGYSNFDSLNFSLTKGEQKPLPDHVDSMLRERIVKGHIVPVKKG